jgi:hypothetical protein
MMTRAVLRSMLVAALVVVLGATPAAAQPKSGPWMQIDQKASEIWLFDGSPDGSGPSVPATTVTASLHDCPAGQYLLVAELVQDGAAAYWATTALGAGEVSCAGGNAPLTVTMGFYGHPVDIHPGRATATFALMTEQGALVGQTTRVVRIPG